MEHLIKHIIDLRSREPLGGQHRVVGTAWHLGMPMRLCIIARDGGWSLGWRTHAPADLVPEDWMDEDGEALPERRTDEGDYAAFGRLGLGMRLPAFHRDQAICGVDSTDGDQFLTWLEDEQPDAGPSDEPLASLDPREVERRVEALEWLGWTDTDERERGPIVQRIIAAAAGRPQTISDELLRAYLETDYVILLPEPVTLNISRGSDGLRNLYKRLGRPGMSVVTAYNPEGVMRDDVLNRMADAHLRRDLQDLDLRSFEAAGRGRIGSWPEEPSHAISAISLEDAAHLGRVHGQNAVVWAGVDAIPKLVLLR